MTTIENKLEQLLNEIDSDKLTNKDANRIIDLLLEENTGIEENIGFKKSIKQLTTRYRENSNQRFNIIKDELRLLVEFKQELMRPEITSKIIRGTYKELMKPFLSDFKSNNPRRKNNAESQFGDIAEPFILAFIHKNQFKYQGNLLLTNEYMISDTFNDFDAYSSARLTTRGLKIENKQGNFNVEIKFRNAEYRGGNASYSFQINKVVKALYDNKVNKNKTIIIVVFGELKTKNMYFHIVEDDIKDYDNIGTLFSKKITINESELISINELK
jgi:hypothetical protein